MNDPIPEKKSNRANFYVVVALAWMCLTIYGLRYGSEGGFRIEDWVQSAAACVAFPLSLAIVLKFVLSTKASPLGLGKRLMAYAGLLAMSFGFLWSGLALGATVLATRYFGSDFSARYQVAWKHDNEGRNRGCRHSIRIKDVGSEWSANLCVDEDFWKSIEQGQILRGSGVQSPFGKIVQTLHKK